MSTLRRGIRFLAVAALAGACGTASGGSGDEGPDATAGPDLAGSDLSGTDLAGSEGTSAELPTDVDCASLAGTSCYVGFLEPFFTCFGSPEGGCTSQKLGVNKAIACWQDGSRVTATERSSSEVSTVFANAGGQTCLTLDALVTGQTTGKATITLAGGTLVIDATSTDAVRVTCPDGTDETHSPADWQSIGACGAGGQPAPQLPSQCSPGLCVKL
jgi:hypothetical protein